MSEKFLSRWSRRKREGEAPPAAPANPPAESGAPLAEPEMLSPEDIAALPPVESVEAAEDLMVFLRKGIPAALRKAALRRLWVLDPEIRDFVGEARDYAWDWNVPGGVPVSGPLDPGTDVAGMVRKLFARRDQSDMPVRENVISREPESEPQSITKLRADPAAEPAAMVEGDEADVIPDEKIVRRHGGALPA